MFGVLMPTILSAQLHTASGALHAEADAGRWHRQKTASARKCRLKAVIKGILTCDHICDKVTKRRARTLMLAAAILGSHPSVQ